MKAGNNIEQINSNGDTPLHLAALNGRLEIVKFLTNQNINKHPRNNNGQTPIDLAELNGKQGVKNFLDEFYKIGNLMDEFFVYNKQSKNYVIGRYKYNFRVNNNRKNCNSYMRARQKKIKYKGPYYFEFSHSGFPHWNDSKIAAISINFLL